MSRHHQRYISIYAQHQSAMHLQNNKLIPIAQAPNHTSPSHNANEPNVEHLRVVGVQQQQRRWVDERENAHARKKKKKGDSRFLNPNKPFSLGSIFN